MQIQQEFRIDNETIYAKRLQISIAIENKSLGCFEVYLKCQISHLKFHVPSSNQNSTETQFDEFESLHVKAVRRLNKICIMTDR